MNFDIFMTEFYFLAAYVNFVIGMGLAYAYVHKGCVTEIILVTLVVTMMGTLSWALLIIFVFLLGLGFLLEVLIELLKTSLSTLRQLARGDV